MGQSVSRFSPNQSMASLGLVVKVGTHFSAVPPADGPEWSEVVRAILRELGSIGVAYRPLWVTHHWRRPNGGTFRTVHHVMGHYDPNPTHKRRPIPGLVMPTVPLYGLHWENPIFEDDILDGLTDSQRVRGMVPKYQPLDMAVLDGIRRTIWERNRVNEEHPEKQADAVAATDAAASAKVYSDVGSEMAYRRHHDDLRLRCVDGEADRVFVSHTLRQQPEHPVA